MRFSLRTLMVVMLLGWPFCQASGQPAPEWTIIFRYGGGTPKDAGPLGHCTASFTSDGKVRIESKGRRGTSGPADVVVYENDRLEPKRLKALLIAADAALSEKSFKRRGEISDGKFLRLERTGTAAARTTHDQFLEFGEAPPEMRRFVTLVNELLPQKERIPIAARSHAK
jgi:hypothetical protein